MLCCGFARTVFCHHEICYALDTHILQAFTHAYSHSAGVNETTRKCFQRIQSIFSSSSSSSNQFLCVCIFFVSVWINNNKRKAIPFDLPVETPLSHHQLRWWTHWILYCFVICSGWTDLTIHIWFAFFSSHRRASHVDCESDLNSFLFHG